MEPVLPSIGTGGMKYKVTFPCVHVSSSAKVGTATPPIGVPPMQVSPGSVADAGAPRLSGSTNNASKVEPSHIAIV